MMLNNPSPDSTNNNQDVTGPDSTALTNGLGLDFSQLSNVVTSSNELNRGLNSSPQNEDFADLDLFSRNMRKDILGSTVLPISSPGESPLTSPPLLSPDVRQNDFGDGNTQMSVVERAADLQLEDHTLWNYVNSDDDCGDLDISRKVLKAHRCSDAATSSNKEEIVDKDKIFEAELAASTVASNPFIFNKFGSDVPGVFTFGANSCSTTTNNVINSPVTIAKPVSAVTPTTLTSVTQNMVDETSQNILPSSQVITIEPKGVHGMKEPSLNLSFPSKGGGYEVKVIVQPEDQHRARYQTEGSRGAVKDKGGNGCPVVKLSGYRLPVNVQIFIGTDSGKVKPHGFYQACKVFGKNATQCTETEIEGTTVIEVMLDPKEDMTANIDCVGILKLRNADVEQRIGLARSKKKSTRARMVFRVNIPKSDGTYQTFQVASNPILCTQPAGIPEICKMSLNQSLPEGGQELFIIGKNFLKGSKVVFQEKSEEMVVWTQEAEIDQEYFHASHIIATIPPYRTCQMTGPVTAEIIVECNGRSSEVTPFIYTPNLEHPPPVLLVNNEPHKLKLEEGTKPKQEVTPMETEPTLKNKCVSPEALALNKQYEEESRRNSGSGVPSMLVEMANSIPPSQGMTDIEMQNPTEQMKIVSEKSPPPHTNVQESLQELQQLMDEHGSDTQNKSTDYTDQISIHSGFENPQDKKNVSNIDQQQQQPQQQQHGFLGENFAASASQILNDNSQYSTKTVEVFPTESQQHTAEQVVHQYSDQPHQGQNSVPSFTTQPPNVEPFSPPQANPSLELNQALATKIGNVGTIEENSPVQSQNTVPQNLFSISSDNTLNSQNEIFNQNQSQPQETFCFPTEQSKVKGEINIEQTPQQGIRQGFGSSNAFLSHLSDDLTQVKQQSPFNTPLPTYTNHNASPLANDSQMPPNMSVENIPQETKHENVTSCMEQQENSQSVTHNPNTMDTSSSLQNTQLIKESSSFIPQSTVTNFGRSNNTNDQHQLSFQDLLGSVNMSQGFSVSQQEQSSVPCNSDILQQSQMAGTQLSADNPVNNLANNVTETQQQTNDYSKNVDSCKAEEQSSAQTSLQDMHKTMQELVALLKCQVKTEPDIKQEGQDNQNKQELLMKALQQKAAFSLPLLAQQVKMTPGIVETNTPSNLVQQQVNPETIPNSVILSPATASLTQTLPISTTPVLTESSQQIKLMTQPSISGGTATNAANLPQQQIKLMPYTIASLPQTMQSNNGKVQVINEAMLRLLLDQTQSGSSDVSALLSKQLQQQGQPVQQTQVKPQLITTSASAATQPVKILRLNSQGQLVSDQTIVANQSAQIFSNQGQIVANPHGQIHSSGTSQGAVQPVIGNQPAQLLPNQPGQIVNNPQIVNSTPTTSPVILPVVRQQHPLKIIPAGKLVTLTNGAPPLIIKGQNVQQPVTVVTEPDNKRDLPPARDHPPGNATRPNGLLAQLLTGPLSSHNHHHQQTMDSGDNWQPPSLFNQDGMQGVEMVYSQNQEKPQH